MTKTEYDTDNIIDTLSLMKLSRDINKYIEDNTSNVTIEIKQDIREHKSHGSNSGKSYTEEFYDVLYYFEYTFYDEEINDITYREEFFKGYDEKDREEIYKDISKTVNKFKRLMCEFDYDCEIENYIGEDVVHEIIKQYENGECIDQIVININTEEK